MALAAQTAGHLGRQTLGPYSRRLSQNLHFEQDPQVICGNTEAGDGLEATDSHIGTTGGISRSDFLSLLREKERERIPRRPRLQVPSHGRDVITGARVKSWTPNRLSHQVPPVLTFVAAAWVGITEFRLRCAVKGTATRVSSKRPLVITLNNKSGRGFGQALDHYF